MWQTARVPHDSSSGGAAPPALAPSLTLIDLRADAARRAAPLHASGDRRVLLLSLDEVEDGTHGLTPASGPLLIVCERGTRSQLAARYLRADGLDVQSWPGSWASFAAALEGS